MKSAHLKIKGMHCKSCEMLIKESLEDTGHAKVKSISHQDGRLELQYDESHLDEGKIRSIVKNEGYEVA